MRTTILVLLLVCIGCTSGKKHEPKAQVETPTKPAVTAPFIVKNESPLPFSKGDSVELKFKGYKWTDRVLVLETCGTFFCTKKGRWMNATALEEVRVFPQEE